MLKGIVSVAGVTLSFCFFPSISLSQQEPPSENRKGADTAVRHYVRAKDAKWYARQLGPLRQELQQIDQEIRVMREARKDGRGTTGAVDLDKAPEGVTADAKLFLLNQQRTEILQRIAEIEDEARRNDVAPGAIRSEEGTAELGTATGSGDNQDASNPEIAETESTLRQERERLERERNEADLLQRKLDLDKRTVYSNPEYTLRRSGKAELTATQNQIAEKQDEIHRTEQRIADLEDQLQNLKLNLDDSSKNTEPNSVTKAKVEDKGEAYWGKRFGEIHYKIRMAQGELDILQRELNVLLLQYDPNPQKAMRESVTRQDINAHRKAIEEKKKEISDLRGSLSNLEDELRHAGGDPGWSRE